MTKRSWAMGAALLAPLAVALAGTVGAAPRPRLVWNGSPSAPVGFYAIGQPERFAAGEMVLARVPLAWRRLAGERRYIPVNVPLVKRLAAGPGDRVCALGPGVFVNGTRVAERRRTDPRGRTMPWWKGCVTLDASHHLLLMDHPHSFDGRYFGPTRKSDIIGKASLL